MPVTFEKIKVGEAYDRPTLAALWGYRAYQAISRGVVTPKGSNKIILFVTQEKQAHLRQYEDHFEGDELHWEGPDDHWAEDRMIDSETSGDEIHVFYRGRHHAPFTYCGRAKVERVKRGTGDMVSQFVLKTEWSTP